MGKMVVLGEEILSKDSSSSLAPGKAFAANKKYGVALAHYDSLKKQMGKDVNTTDKQILAEAMDVEAEYKEEVSNNKSDTSNEN